MKHSMEQLLDPNLFRILRRMRIHVCTNSTSNCTIEENHDFLCIFTRCVTIMCILIPAFSTEPFRILDGVDVWRLSCKLSYILGAWPTVPRQASRNYIRTWLIQFLIDCIKITNKLLACTNHNRFPCSVTKKSGMQDLVRIKTKVPKIVQN